MQRAGCRSLVGDNMKKICILHFTLLQRLLASCSFFFVLWIFLYFYLCFYPSCMLHIYLCIYLFGKCFLNPEVMAAGNRTKQFLQTYHYNFSTAATALTSIFWADINYVKVSCTPITFGTAKISSFLYDDGNIAHLFLILLIPNPTHLTLDRTVAEYENG